MHKQNALSVILCLLLVSIVLTNQIGRSADSQVPSLSTDESNIILGINGTNVYNYDLELEKIALNPNISGYSFRSAGSPGANEAANWIKTKFESFGLETTMESFDFTTWNLPTQPSLVIDEDSNESTTNDQVAISSFQSAHFSWPTPDGGVFSEIVVLPLPQAASISGLRQTRNYDAEAWSTTNTTDKVLLIGREIRFGASLQQLFFSKLRAQPPSAVIFTWWYDWMNFTPPMFASVGGLPASSLGSYFWDLKIPVGWVNYEDGMLIRNKIQNMNISARVTINSSIGIGPHYNVVGRLPGSVNPEKTIIISGHYDTVMCAGFCDNGAGVAGVIELARVFADAAKNGTYVPRCTLLFIAFTAEELGLVGSTNYMLQHKNEIKDIKAVINLDCIGNDKLQVSETFPNDGLDLDEVALRAAEDLGVEANWTEVGGSDQETFRNPAGTSFIVRMFWKKDPGISNMSSVGASIMLDSVPLFYSDKWEMGKPGWIHTENDNSTSTESFGWVEAGKLEEHVKVAGLTVMRAISQIYSPFYLQIMGVTAAVGAGLIVAMYFERSTVRSAVRKVRSEIRRYIGLRETIYIIILASVFFFICFALNSKVVRTELNVEGFPTVVTATNFGAPFEMFQILYNVEGGTVDLSEGIPSLAADYRGGVLVMWQGFILNLIFCLILAFTITYLAMKLRK